MNEYIQKAEVSSAGIVYNKLIPKASVTPSFKVKITAGDSEEDFLLSKFVFGDGLSGTEEYDENGKGIIRVELELSPGDFSALSVNISSAEWLNMYTTTKSILPALTGLKYYEIYNLAIAMIYNSQPYNSSGYYITQLLKDTVENRIVMNNNTNLFAGRTVSCVSFLRNTQGADGFALPLNAGLYLKHSDQGMAGGNSDFKVKGIYRIIDLST
jgi:hypothetical protein